MALKILKALKKSPSIKHLIHARVAGVEPARDHYPLHASDLMKELEFCPREHAFMDMGVAKKQSQFIGTSMAITFAHGRDMESRLRNEWLRDLAVGHWECGVCGYVHPTFGKAPTIKCPTCGWGHKWTYKEVRFESPTSGIGGRFDLLVDVSEAKLRVVEIKSIDKDQFKDLAGPLAEHKFRTALYLGLADQSDMPESDRVNTHEAHIIYVSKSFGFKDTSLAEAGIKDAAFSPFKEYIIQRDDEMTATPVNKAKALKAWRENPNGGLPCQICVNGLTKRAQKCSAIGPCWGGSYPSTVTWLENGKPRHPGKLVIE